MLVEVSGLGVNLAGRTVLTGVDFAIARGEIVTIVGPNGSGKSTLLKAIVGALRPTAGTVRRARGLTLGYVPQTLGIDASLPMTVERFLSLPHRRPREAVAGALRSVGMEHHARAQLSALSGGQLQRVLLARAVIGRPDLLILDEPTQGLDQPATAAFYELIERLSGELDAAVLMVGHDLHVVMSASDRVICLNGHICCQGTPASVSSAPEYRALFGRGTRGTLALYRHEHDHGHDHGAHLVVPPSIVSEPGPADTAARGSDADA